MDLLTLAAIGIAYKIGQGLKGKDAVAADHQPEELPMPAPPIEFSEAQADQLAAEDPSGGRIFRPENHRRLVARLMRTSLERVRSPEGVGVIFFRLIPLAGVSAFDTIASMRQHGGSVACSLSCFLPSGERLVAIAMGPMPDMIKNSPHFAAFHEKPIEPIPSNSASTVAVDIANGKTTASAKKTKVGETEINILHPYR